MSLQKINIIEYFELEGYLKGNRFTGPCPVHGGDNRSGFSFWPYSGFWACRTHQCHHKWGNNFFGLLRGIASNMVQKKNLEEIIDAISELKTTDTITYNLPVKQEINISLEEFLEDKIHPCPIYTRKFDYELCKKHYISFSTNGKQYERSVVPLFSDDMRVIGWTGRSRWDKCAHCKGFHNPDRSCPEYFSPKWKCSEGCPTEKTLFNIWHAKKFIESTQKVYLTESVGNTLRLEEFGIFNSVANLGTNFSQKHAELLKEIGVKQIIYVKDAGEAGLEAAERVKKHDEFEVIVPEIDIYDDIAACSKEFFKERIMNKLCI